MQDFKMARTIYNEWLAKFEIEITFQIDLLKEPF